MFSANGGNLYAGGYFAGPGGGGRVALYYEASSFTGKAQALGGCGSYDGWSKTCAKDGTVGFFDTANNNFTTNTSWLFQKNDSPFNFNKIILAGSAKVFSEKETEITANELLIKETSQFTLAENQIIDIPSITLINGSLIFSGSETLTTDTLILTENSTITIAPEKILSLAIQNISIGVGAIISVNGKGYLDGPGAPSIEFAGASYGGLGARNILSSIYGSETEPIDFGSGGINNYRGGGAIRIATDTLLNDGTISANGDANSSGGSIYITSTDLSGNGTFRADGGQTFFGSMAYVPGGGGRIAIHYKSSSFTGETLVSGMKTYYGDSMDGTIKMIDTSTIDPDPNPPPPDPEPPAEPIPDNEIAPLITSYTFNTVADNITINPLVNPLSMVFTASKNVDWVSIKIEKENSENVDIHKYYYPGNDCDGKNTCTQDWDGKLIGELLQNGTTYKVKVKVRDLVSEEEYVYLSPYVITVNTN